MALTPNSIEVQREFGLQVDFFLKVATQFDRVVKRAFRMPAFIRWGIEYQMHEVMMQFDMTLVGLHLEYRV